jgi:hypothetical protein
MREGGASYYALPHMITGGWGHIVMNSPPILTSEGLLLRAPQHELLDGPVEAAVLERPGDHLLPAKER